MFLYLYFYSTNISNPLVEYVRSSWQPIQKSYYMVRGIYMHTINTIE